MRDDERAGPAANGANAVHRERTVLGTGSSLQEGRGPSKPAPVGWDLPEEMTRRYADVLGVSGGARVEATASLREPPAPREPSIAFDLSEPKTVPRDQVAPRS